MSAFLHWLIKTNLIKNISPFRGDRFFRFFSLVLTSSFLSFSEEGHPCPDLLRIYYLKILFTHPSLLIEIKKEEEKFMANKNESHDQQVDQWMKILNLKPHREGGFYAETYASDDQCSLQRYEQKIRPCSGAIYYLLQTPNSPRSHFHRIQADEMWHFYQGLPLIIHVLDEETSSHIEWILDNRLDLNSEARPQVLVPHGKWFGAEIVTTAMEERQQNYTLCGCTCTPGFDFEEFECAKRSYLLEKFPNLQELITRLTPSD